MIKVEDWAEIRRLHRAEGVPIKEIGRRLGVARNTVRAALTSDRVPAYERPRRASVVDPVEPAVRALLASWPKMPATVIAERIKWPHSISPLKKRLQQIRPEYVGVDPVDRVVYQPGDVAQCDLWFPEPKIPVGSGQLRVLPVLVMTLGYSRFLTASMIPSRQAGDIAGSKKPPASRTSAAAVNSCRAPGRPPVGRRLLAADAQICPVDDGAQKCAS